MTAKQDRIVISILFLYTTISALCLPVNPWPRDFWFESQYWLFESFPGADNATPISAPAILYQLTHWLAALLGLELRSELYLASIVQNCLMFLAAVLIYRTGRLLVSRFIAGGVAILFLIFVLSTGLAQAFWSENIVLFLFSATLFLSVRMLSAHPQAARDFWRTTVQNGFLIGILVATRVTPLLLIPGLAMLFFGRLNSRKLAGFLAVVSVITALLLAALLASNYARFGRIELTNSTGRHLWQGVTLIADRALADSAEYQALKRTNPDIEGMNYWEIQLPDDDARQFDGEELFGRLAKQAIANEPLLYLRLGLSNFAETIGTRPYRLGFGKRGDQYDPLNTAEPLPPIAEVQLNVPPLLIEIVAKAIRRIFWASQWIYPAIIFLVLSTWSALTIRRIDSRTTMNGSTRTTVNRARRQAAIFLLMGIATICLVLFGISSIKSLFLVGGLCVSLLALQVLIFYFQADDAAGTTSVVCSSERFSIYSFLALLFFGSLWFSWQVENNNSRNALPYLPFLALMMCLALPYWLSGVSRVVSACRSLSRGRLQRL